MTATAVLLSLCYVVAAVLFILCLRGLSGPQTARRGLVLGEVGMLIAVVGTLLHREIVTYEWILAGLLIGSTIGIAISATIPMTKMPERIALSHSFGGLATGLVGIAEYVREGQSLQHAVPAGHWFGSQPEPGTAFSFVSCTVAPGFDFADFELGERSDLLKRFPGASAAIRRLTDAP